MAIHMPLVIQAKQVLGRSFSNGSKTSRSFDIPKGYFGVYVGEQETRRFVVPISLLNGSKTSRSIDIPKGYFGVYVGEQETRRFVPVVRRYVFSRVGFAIQKGVAAQLVARLPTQDDL